MGLTSCYRTHTCGDLTRANSDEEVVLSGWILRKRDHGGVVFVDLRDHYGVTQVVFNEHDRELVQSTRVESVIRVRGTVAIRSDELVNSKIPTGEVEVQCQELEILSEADVLPFQIAEDDNAAEAARLKYRFLDLRRERLHNNIQLRSQVISAIREIMTGMGFLEMQTPILTSSSPEGARDYLVPSRIHPGKFFALPQAPQQFKQLLMVAGFDRYFQIAPCFRDEDPRADRSPGEFYQLDLEMSFVEQDDVFAAIEGCFDQLFDRFSGDWDVCDIPFKRIPYKEAMELYGTDKPDLRNPLQMCNGTEIFKDTEFKVFRNEVEQGGDVVLLPCEVEEVPPRKFFDDTIDEFRKASGRGLAYLVFEEDGHKGSIAKFMSDKEIAAIREQVGVKGTTLVFFGAGPSKEILPRMGELRTKLGNHFDKLEKNVYRFCWITDFPMYEADEETGEIAFSHNPFSMPQGGIEALETKDPLDILAWQYDLVCNGVELSSGAIRNHSPDIMYKAFEIAGYSKEEVDAEFGGMIRAFKFGAPPHGGFAPGIDRIVMLLARENNIREVITFPMAQSVEDLMMGSPSQVSEKQLKEVHIKLDLPEEEEE